MPTLKFLAVLACTLLCIACGQEKDTFTDTRDGKVYKTVKIGGQVWMAENLSYKAESSKCYGEDGKVYNLAEVMITLGSAEIQANCEKYGRLYNWETAIKACPDGWHLPNKAEWHELVVAVGGAETAGEYLKATSGWARYMVIISGNGRDKYGFSALPSGFRYPDHGGGEDFYGMGYGGTWWTASERPYKNARTVQAEYRSSYLSLRDEQKDYLYSVRCLQGPPPKAKEPPALQIGTFTDERDGKTYKTTKIGTQTWMAENLSYKAESSKCYGEDGKVVGPVDSKKGQQYVTLSNTEIQANCDKYGRLYNWETAMKACPSGWHLPDTTEWGVLENTVDDDDDLLTSAKHLKAVSEWYEDTDPVGEKIKGIDTYGFSALPGGYKEDKGFTQLRYGGGWWTSNNYSSDYAYYKYMSSSWRGGNQVLGRQNNKNYLYSVRCLQNTPAPPKGEAK